MTHQLTRLRGLDRRDEGELERNRRLFFLARAQLAAARTEPLRLDVARRSWRSHRRRFS